MTLLSEQEIVRRDKLKKIKQGGFQPYPAALYPISHYSQSIKQHYSEETKEQFAHVTLAGRITTINDKGKVQFIKIQDCYGIIQIYIKKDDICTETSSHIWDILIKNLDLGDIIGVKGFVFITKMGEISVHAKEITLLSKSLKPLPVVKRDDQGHIYDAVTDPEFKYRQRYADMLINPDIKNIFIQRSRIIHIIRQFLNKQGALEVDTPILQSIPGGAAAKPFITHHNALNIPFYLRISNELYLKRLIVGGFDWVYEFSRDFRNEGMDRTHNPEFTILEWYTAYKDYMWMMNITEKLLETITEQLYGTTTISIHQQEINFKPPYKRISVYEAIQEKITQGIEEKKYTDIPTIVEHWQDKDWKKFCADYMHLQEPILSKLGKGKLIDEVFSYLCEEMLIQPTFVIDHPIEMSPLAKNTEQKKASWKDLNYTYKAKK